MYRAKVSFVIGDVRARIGRRSRLEARGHGERRICARPVEAKVPALLPGNNGLFVYSSLVMHPTAQISIGEL